MALKLGNIAKIPPKQKILLAVLACIILGVGYYYMFYAKAAQEKKTLEDNLGKMNSTIKEQEVIARNLPSFQAEVRHLEGELGLLLDQLPNSAEIPSLLGSISEIGRECGLDFLKFAPKPEIKKEFYAEIPVSLQVTGGYHGFLKFADRVGRLPRIVNLMDIAFTPAKKEKSGTGRVGVNVTCSVTTFRFLEQAAPPPAPVKGKKK